MIIETLWQYTHTKHSIQLIKDIVGWLDKEKYMKIVMKFVKEKKKITTYNIEILN